MFDPVQQHDVQITSQRSDAQGERAAAGETRVPARRAFLRRSLTGMALAVPVGGLLVACGSSSTMTGAASTPTSAATSAPTSPTRLLSLASVADSGSAFREIMQDENAHVTFLQQALTKAGVQPRPKPTFKNLEQMDVQSFAQVAQTFENVGVGAYLMAAPAIATKAYLAAAGSILTVEARHAGFLDALLNKPLSANGAFDKPLSQAEIVSAVSPFIASLNGGSDPSASLKNDAAILNFALLLEFLEAEFYNVNVPKFFK
ncbi:ferritin-like domain-containing protein [Thermogemmatispora onikobensis]|uniref:ferritin-like domain-containing protein n=1 Tax=Thermogemmatispora onikobensis TaxID=732234 RepID=UPI0008534D07|nr:ferritin-like domain-containing protein [Thermogemmatispora onikobensis]